MSGHKKRKLDKSYFNHLKHYGDDDEDDYSNENDDDRMEREVREEEDEKDDWVEKLIDQEILLEECIYGNCFKCYCMSLPCFGCPNRMCKGTVVKFKTFYEVCDNKGIIVNPLLLHNLLSHGDIIVRPKTKLACDVNAMKVLEMEDIPTKAKKKAILIVESIITKDPSVLDDDEHEWFDLIAKTSSMDKFRRLKSHLDVKENKNH